MGYIYEIIFLGSFPLVTCKSYLIAVLIETASKVISVGIALPEILRSISTLLLPLWFHLVAWLGKKVFSTSKLITKGIYNDIVAMCVFELKGVMRRIISSVNLVGTFILCIVNKLKIHLNLIPWCSTIVNMTAIWMMVCQDKC